MAAPADVAALAERLNHAEARVRRIAATDLAKAGTAEAWARLTARLPLESDEKTAIQIARALAEGKVTAAMTALAAIRDDPRTPVRVYHAAVLAHDALERA